MKRLSLISVFCLVASFATIAVPRTASATNPTEYFWYVGQGSPTLFTNAEGYCWLVSVNISNTTPTTANLTFSSNFTWEFTGTGDEDSYAMADCLPWSAISPHGEYNVMFNYQVFSYKSPTSYSINPSHAESICNIQGFSGELDNNKGFVNINGYMEEDHEQSNFNATKASMWATCAQINYSGGTPQPSNTCVGAGQNSVDLGSSANQMCWIQEIDGDDYGNDYTTGGVYQAGNGQGGFDYVLYNNGGAGTICANCLHLPLQ